jgi:N utilization substance protein B
MGKRREGREAAIQFLYQLDLNPESVDSLRTKFWELRTGPGQAPVPTRTQRFADQLVDGVIANSATINQRISACVENYDLNRIAPVDRNILRLAIYEMLFCPDIPPVVSINEAIEIAKKFGGEESSRFVNGVLDKIRSHLTRPSRTAEPPAPTPPQAPAES